MIRVMIAEDTDAERDTVVALLDLEVDIEVCAAVASGDDVVPTALTHHPDVAVLDVGLPGTDGIAAAAELATKLPGCRVLILTALDDRASLAAALNVGVSGYLLKGGQASGIIDAVRAVARGEQVVDARLRRSPSDGEGGHLTG